MGNRARTRSSGLEVDAEEIRRRSDEILARVARLTDLDAEEREAQPETLSSERATQAVEAPANEAPRVVTNGQVLVRDWLALQIGCAANELSVIERRDRAFDVVFARNGERYGEAYVLAPQVPGGWDGSIALIGVWKPGRWCQQILGPATTFEW